MSEIVKMFSNHNTIKILFSLLFKAYMIKNTSWFYLLPDKLKITNTNITFLKICLYLGYNFQKISKLVFKLLIFSKC